MSDNAIIVVELSLTGEKAAERIAAAKKWLLDQGVIEKNAERDEVMHPSEYRAGPRAAEIAPPLAHDHIRALANNGVDFVYGRQVHHPTENYEPPPCPSCGVPADPDAHHGLIEGWLEDGEPALPCEACGKEHLAGDWIGEFSFFVGEIAVRFNNWGEIESSFLDELGAVLGPRARVVYEHS